MSGAPATLFKPSCNFCYATSVDWKMLTLFIMVEFLLIAIVYMYLRWYKC